MTTREDILSLATPVLWQAWRSNDWEAESNPDWTEFEDEDSARGWARGCMFNGVRPLYAAPTPPAAEAPGQGPVAWRYWSKAGLWVLSDSPADIDALRRAFPSIKIEALYPAPPIYADAEAKGLKELQAWVLAERLALVPLEPDFLPKYSTLKAVGKKVCDMLAIRSLASPAPRGET